MLSEPGFVGGKSSPCLLWNEKRGLRSANHGDDAAVMRDYESLSWFEQALGENLEVGIRARLGPERTEAESVRILNRIVEWRPDGIWYDPNQRHVEAVVQALGLATSKAAVTPGADAAGRGIVPKTGGNSARPTRVGSAGWRRR